MHLHENSPSRRGGGIPKQPQQQTDEPLQFHLRGPRKNGISRNVVRTVREVIAMSPAIGELISSTQIGIVGMMYDVGSGTVRVIEETQSGFAGTSQDKNQLWDIGSLVGSASHACHPAT